MKTRRFITRNDSFTCTHCGKKVLPRKGGCRNHCSFCLYSLHVDGPLPGDRGSECRGLMQPVSVEQKHGGWRILHRCVTCEMERWNGVAADDNENEIIRLSTGNASY